MAQVGSVAATTVKALTASSYQNECKSATARVNCCCASALQETGKPTSPTLPMACACNAVGAASDVARAEASSALRSEICAIANTPVRVSNFAVPHRIRITFASPAAAIKTNYIREGCQLHLKPAGAIGSAES